MSTEGLPAQPEAGAIADGSWADAYGPFSPPITVGDFESNTMLLSTGLAALLGFLVTLTFNTSVSDPYLALSMVYADS